MARLTGNIDIMSVEDVKILLDMLTKRGSSEEIEFLAAVLQRFLTIE